MSNELNLDLPFEAPAYTGKALGFRYWNFGVDITTRVPFIEAASKIAEWIPGENIAACLRQPSEIRHLDSAPSGKCNCGFNAWNNTDSIQLRMYQLSFLVKGELPIVCGSIEGYGNMQIHKDGWRSEKARVVGFVRPDKKLFSDYKSEILRTTSEEAFDQLAEAFDVPVFDNFVDLHRYSSQHTIDLSKDPIYDELDNQELLSVSKT